MSWDISEFEIFPFLKPDFEFGTVFLIPPVDLFVNFIRVMEMEVDSQLISSAVQNEDVSRGERLVLAAGEGDIALVKHLLESGVSVNADEYNKSLFYASRNYMTPLQTACEKNQYEVVKLLVDAGADVNSKDRFDVTAVHTAAQNGNILCLRELLDAGAECSVPTKHSKKGCYTATPHAGGTTPLHLAAVGNKIECVVELIQAGADYNAIDEKGRTSLFLAASCGYEDCMLAHLKNAVGRDILSLPSLESGDTPLHFAVKNGMVHAVKELLDLGSDPNHLNHAGSSPIHYAVSTNPDIEGSCETILRLLVLDGYNVDVNEPDGSGFTPLHYVCFNAGVSFVRRPNLACFLIAYGANPMIKNQRGYNVIEYEMKGGDKDQRILRFVVQSMLHLPPLQSLKINVLPPPPPPPAVTAFEAFLTPMEQLFADRAHIDHDHWPIDREFRRAFNLPTNSRPQRPRNAIAEQKHQWYALIAAQPRTLQHYCRYQIRSSMGYRRLRHIKDLRIPLRLQHYLLLQNDDL